MFYHLTTYGTLVRKYAEWEHLDAESVAILLKLSTGNFTVVIRL